MWPALFPLGGVFVAGRWNPDEVQVRSSRPSMTQHLAAQSHKKPRQMAQVQENAPPVLDG